ncbi:lysophospholipid acyltransferase family protein [Paracoccus sp. CPCC 101403]|uniref:Lysophospholipid acyltransferase family protein n=2 Tax=Paracoccus broussonetiae TaxID=3075834 RepID=A0ABU3E7U7_9RHOB|nr:lysophospholipid acyltransferase family protein [Paracoccus sp. CPCC 101403]MDT1060273.1 lysophospholipid acyltransferase family protein [Paracoccus sp. CPCC 101403]
MQPAYRPRPASAIDWLRTGAFYLYAAVMTLLVGLVGLPGTLIDGANAQRTATRWLRLMMGGARVIAGIRVEYRGTPPAGDLLVAAKHQSFLDILAIAQACPRRAFVMKREVLNVPVMGWFARKVGSIPIDRARGSEAMRQITTGVAAARAKPQGLGQLIFYPEGTRTRPGSSAPYKPGVALVQHSTGLPIIPVAVNCGLFWPKRGFPIRPGVAVVEFLPAITADTSVEAAMAQLTDRIETASLRLFNEAGGAAALAGQKHAN